MSEKSEITTGDVVCLKSDTADSHGRRFTVGTHVTNSEVRVHWFTGGEFKTSQVNKDALHKIK